MFVYEITTGEYEYQCNWLLQHKNQYSKEEFLNIIKGAVNYLKRRNLEYNDNIEVIGVLEEVYEFKKYKIPIEQGEYFRWSISQILDN